MRPKRTDSDASASSWRSRRDSIDKLARRMSNSFIEKVDIVKMDRNDRAGYVRRKNSEASQIGKFARDSMDSFSGDSTLDLLAESEGKPKPGNLTRGEKLALGISKAVDPVKRGRTGTNDSNMSFSMTDLAPPGAMQSCSRCARATDAFLKGWSVSSVL